ncbi:ion channel [Nocardiopsis sp. YSL2]|uniref:ion channel n=1 Tax=Nocardiopsis sp. YSL2 TaxID=2939492 RepID=UPI0026F41F9B|nr:ion channel [Nocardiopsis sp. YSL2]
MTKGSTGGLPWNRTFLLVEVVAVLALYYLLPLEEGAWQVVPRWALFALGAGLICWSVVHTARRQARVNPGELSPHVPVLLAVSGLTLFALADYALATAYPGEFEGLETRTDALYFALTTLATVGFGDIHAQGQYARALLLAQMSFNLVVIAGAVSLLTARLRARRHGGGR